MTDHMTSALVTPDPMADAPEWAVYVMAMMEKNLAATREMEATLSAILRKFDEVTEDLKPMIDKLSGSTMFRMMTGGGK